MERLIVCCGDSFTAGVELAADDLIPNYTSNLLGNYDVIPPEMEALDTKFKHAVNSLPKPLQQKYWEKEKSMAWPSFLHSKKNVVYNESSGGISNQEICGRTISKLEAIKNKKGKKYALVMLTSSERYAHPSSHSINPYGYPYKQLYQQTLTKKYSPDHDITEYWYLHHSSIDMFWHSYNSIHGLINYCRHNRVQLTIFDSCLWNWSYKHMQEYSSKDPRLSTVLSLFKTIPITYNMSDFAGPKTKLPGGHFCLDVHKKFGKAVSDLL